MAQALNTIPTEITVGAWVYRVDVMEGNPPSGTEDVPDSHLLWGRCNRHTRVIEVCNIGQMEGPLMLASTLVHECLHAIYEDRVRLAIVGRGPDDELLEEMIVQNTEYGMASLMVNNPELQKWLAKYWK